MNTPVPLSDRTPSSSAVNAGASGTGTPPRDSPTTGASFAQVLSGLPKLGATPIGAAAASAASGKGAAVATVKPMIVTSAAGPSIDPAPGTDPAMIPALPAMISTPAARIATAADDPEAAPQPPTHAAPSSKVAAKAAPGTVKHAARQDADATLPLPQAVASIVDPPPLPLRPTALVSVSTEHGQAATDPHSAPASMTAASDPQAGKVTLDPVAVSPHASSAVPFMAPAMETAAQALATLPMDMPVNSALLAGAAGVAATATPAAPNAAKPAALDGLSAAGPAAQLAPALVQIGHAAGSNHITVRLDPLELGSVAIRIDRGEGGTASVQVTVERPETLRLLLSDQPQLQRALDAAGLPQDGRTVTVTLATPDPSPAGGSSASTGGDGSSGANPGGGFGGQPGGRQGQRPSQTIPIAGLAHPTSGWLRAGIDITA